MAQVLADGERRRGEGPAVPAARAAAADPATRVAWGPAPTLGGVPGEAYLGRYVVEVYGGHAQVAMIGGGTGLRDRAVAALRLARPPFLREPDPWPARPVMDRESVGGAYQGRVVVEMWTVATKLAVSVSGGRSPAELIERAATELSAIWVP